MSLPDANPSKRSNADCDAPIVHDLKTWPLYFQAVVDGRKTFELRINDRDFQVGDFLRLQEWSQPANEKVHYTGREIIVRVSYLLEGGKFGLEDGYVVMGLKLP